LIVYVHGFNSSPASFKAGLIKRELERRGRGAEFLAPALPHRPAAAIALLEQLLGAEPQVSLIGSSLGGYYSTFLAECHGWRAVLVNPSVRPYDTLAGCIGRQKNLYTAEEYDFTAGHVAELHALDVAAITRAERYLLLVTTGDELLDYRQAVGKYRAARQVVVEGGDHGFSTFADHLDTVLEFAGA
jgi:predicted esterase YcpF (UPF0227 family)